MSKAEVQKVGSTNGNGGTRKVSGTASKPHVRVQSPTGGKATKSIGFFEAIGGFLKKIYAAVVNFLRWAYGLSKPNEVPYAKYTRRFETDLKKEIALPMHKNNKISARAQVLFNHSKELIDYVNKHGLKNIPRNLGVQMSGDLSLLAGYSDKQRYEYNCAVYFWSSNVLERLSSGDVEGALRTILDIEDLDNTNLNKNTTTWGTPRVQSNRVRHWNKKGYEIAQVHLGTKLYLNTARALFPNAMYARNEGLEGSAIIGEHGSPLGEIYGRSLMGQIIAADQTDVATMNGTLIHRANMPTRFSNKLIRADEILRFLQKIKFGDKTFIQDYFINPTEEHEFTAAEPKGVTDYMLDTHRVLGEVYYPHYLMIAEWKEKYVDRRKKSESLEQGWKNFADCVKIDIDSGIEAYRTLDKLIKSGASEERIQKARKDAYCHIRLIGADPQTRKKELEKAKELGATDYYKLLCTNPQAFFEKVTHGRLTGLNYHFFNSRGTPLSRIKNKDGTYGMDATEQAIYTLNRYANHPQVRKKVQELNSLTIGRKPLHKDLESFRRKGIEIVSRDLMEYVNWRICNHLMFLYTRAQIESIENGREENEGVRLFDTSSESELNFSDEFLELGRKVYEKNGLKVYIKWLSSQFFHSSGDKQFSHSVGLESDLVGFVQSIIPFNISREDIDYKFYDSKGERFNFSRNHFLPNELFSINNKIAYTGEDDFSSIFNLVDKRDIEYVTRKPKGEKHIFVPYLPTTNLNKIKHSEAKKPLGFYMIPGANPDQQYYPELLEGDKFLVVPSWLSCKKKNYAVISAGDSRSDIRTHVKALELGCKDKPLGMAEVVFGLIQDSQIYKEAFHQRLQYLEDEKKTLSLGDEDEERMSLLEAHKEYGIYALEKRPGDKFRKVIDVKQVRRANNEKEQFQYVYLNNDEREFTREEIIDDIKNLYTGRIVHYRCPEAKICARANIIELMTGQNTDFNDLDYAQALSAHEKLIKGNKLSREEFDVLANYSWAITENKYESFLSQETPRFRVYYEYYDQVGNVYYKRKEDGRLITKDGKLYTEDERALRKIAIKRNLDGNFVRTIDGKEEPFNDIDFLNKCLCEEEFLPSTSPKQGLLTRKWLINLFGFGDTKNGEKRLKTFVTNLPQVFNKVLEWSGGLMALGGVVRLVSRLTGGLEETFYKSGYWMSNGLRAVSAAAAALRGELNVHKHHNIFIGEMVNIFAALGLPDGLKHAFLGLGNLVLFLGRGQQRAQMMQRANNHPDEVLNNGPNKDKYIDPRPYVRDVTKFSTKLILDAKKSAKGYGIPPILGEIVGNIASAVLTPVQMIKDVFSSPKLVFQGGYRRAEKSGEKYFAIPSAGHLLTIVGALSGIGALVAGTFGRIGDAAEDGFNKVGKFFISFANAIAAPGIIFNGIEVGGNPLGLPRLSRDLNGNEVRYDPERAGLGQIIAGIGYAIVPWFGLHKKEVASLYDIVNGMYFGFPGARMSVAEEEKLNTIAMARNILIEGQQYYHENESKILKGNISIEEAQRRAA